MYNIFHENGVIVKPNVIEKGDQVTVHYDGLLYKSGAQSVYMHTGYGDNWKEENDTQMLKVHDGFEANVQIPNSSDNTLNIAFKDCANNWDNNSAKNYSFEVQNKSTI